MVAAQLFRRILDIIAVIRAWGAENELKSIIRDVRLFVLDAGVKTKPWVVNWETVEGFMLFSDFQFFHGFWRTASQLIPELIDHMFIRRITKFRDEAGWHTEIQTVTDNKSYTFHGDTQFSVDEAIFESQIGRKILFQDNLYRDSVRLDNVQDQDLIFMMYSAIENMEDIDLPPPRTRRLINKIDRYLDDLPDLPSEDEEDDGYGGDMEWDFNDESVETKEWYPNSEFTLWD